MRQIIKRLWSDVSPAKRLTVAVILISYLGVLGVGLQCSEPMIGDEVTHYYLLMTQAKVFPAPTVRAEIPLACNRSETRSYPHVFLWHYAGAALVKVLGSSFGLIQFYQSLFWLQLLVIFYKFVSREPDSDEWSTLISVTVLASVPMCLIFSVAFYQDIPAIAQIMTSFYFLRRRKMWHSLLFMCLALSVKETVFVFLPAYALCLVLFFRDTDLWWKRGLRLVAAGSVILLLLGSTSTLFKYQVKKPYYPRILLNQALSRFGLAPREEAKRPERVSNGNTETNTFPGVATPKSRPLEIANNPGDLRKPENFIIYGGGLFWLVALAGTTGAVWAWRRSARGTAWWGWVGLWYLVCTAWVMRMAPDARFFLPGMIFLIPPLTRATGQLPRRRVVLALVMLIALAQSSVVLAKTWQMRRIRPGVKEAIQYLVDHPLDVRGDKVFMYPEGSYRLFPCGVNWYLSWRLKEFWRADNDARIRMCDDFNVGAIVVKKYLVGKIDPRMTNLGIYPDFFVRDIERDRRFVKVHDNPDVAIYLVPLPPYDLWMKQRLLNRAIRDRNAEARRAASRNQHPLRANTPESNSAALPGSQTTNAHRIDLPEPR
jgi:hypothetical protein